MHAKRFHIEIEKKKERKKTQKNKISDFQTAVVLGKH